jgi:hypothetical protein
MYAVFGGKEPWDMKGKWIAVLVLGALALFLCAQAAAQQDDGDQPPSALYPRVQVIDIEQDIINAGLETPAMTPIQARREKHLKSLIRLRESFKTRILASVKVL